MGKNRIKNTIVSVLILSLLIGSYFVYTSLTEPRLTRFQRPPTGRVFTIARGNMSVGINGSNKITGSFPKKVTISVEQNEIKSVQIGQEAEIWIPELASNFRGEVASISNTTKDTHEPNSYNVTVLIIEGDSIKDGMLAEVQIALETKKNVIKVPVQAVEKRQNGGYFVWIAPAEGTNQQPVRRFVKIGAMDERNAEIISGLEEGERIVVPSTQY